MYKKAAKNKCNWYKTIKVFCGESFCRKKLDDMHNF